MMKISHESPLSMLPLSRKYNDYDYALVHLFDEIPEYFNFFKESLKQGRCVVLDNSIFELGHAFDSDKFAERIIELKPTEYIIPDVLEDVEGTLNKFYNWMNKYKNLPGKKIGVVQGKTYEEIVHCYRSMDTYCDKIAISFDYSYYRTYTGSDNKFWDWMIGRQYLIDKLLDDNVINRGKPHHLLGASLPQEFIHYNTPLYSFIESVDTSNPIVHGMLGTRYSSVGLSFKFSSKLVEFMNSVPTPVQAENIFFNINKFKEFVNGKK